MRVRVSLEAAFLEHEGSDARGRVGAAHASARHDCGGWRFLLLGSKALAGDARQLLYLVRVRVRVGVGVGVGVGARIRVRSGLARQLLYRWLSHEGAAAGGRR